MMDEMNQASDLPVRRLAAGRSSSGGWAVSSTTSWTRRASGPVACASPDRVDLVTLAQAVIGRFADELKTRSVDVLLHAPAPVGGRWDARRIEQVITNLLSNAIKYGERRPVGVVVQEQAGGALLRVEDQGIGMEAEVRQRLFRPFERGARFTVALPAEIVA